MTWIVVGVCLCGAMHISAILSLAQSKPRTPILLDTDIGTDIDDPFALGLALGSDELVVRGVTASGDDTQKRAMMLCRFLTATGRRHTRVAAGVEPQPSRPITDQFKYYHHPDALFDRTTKPETQPAADFLYSRLKQQPGGVTIVAIGPLTNIARLLESHDDAAKTIRQVVFLESNLSHDVDAARKVMASNVPLVILSNDALKRLSLDATGLKSVFSPGTPLTRQMQALHQMSNVERPPLGEALAVAICIDDKFATVEEQSLFIDESGALKREPGNANARVVTEVDSDKFINWYTGRISSWVAPSSKPSHLLPPGKMPLRVHVAEDFDTDIERYWWMSGKPETKLLPPGSSRACRGVLTHDFDALLMPSRRMYSAVVFNPVPGPPMGRNTRLRFWYRLNGTDTIRVQIYSLTNGYHRHVVVNDLPQGKWRLATVDMTQARRPDGTGGPLGENERIDDIQFYVDPDAELLIDDIVLYDAAMDDGQRLFPKRIMFTGIFDTGKQGQHWPGDFEIVADEDAFWKVAQSVANEKTGQPWIRVGLRGPRRLGKKTEVSFRYRFIGNGPLEVRLMDSASGMFQAAQVKKISADPWTQTTVVFDTRELPSIDEIQLLAPKESTLFIDDLLLYEPGAE